jgi:hypothetical protein
MWKYDPVPQGRLKILPHEGHDCAALG